MEKKQISGLVSILISAAIAIAALWGYNIVVVQPLAEQMAEQSSAWQNTADPSTGAGQVLYGTEAQGGDRAVGDTNVTNLVARGTDGGRGVDGASGGQTITAGGRRSERGRLTLATGSICLHRRLWL